MFARLQILGLVLVGATIIGCQSPLDVATITQGHTGVGQSAGNASLSIVGPRQIQAKGLYTWQILASGLPVGQCGYEWVAAYPASGRTVALGSGDSQSLVVRIDDGDIHLTVSATCLPSSVTGTLLVVNRIAPEDPR